VQRPPLCLLLLVVVAAGCGGAKGVAPQTTASTTQASACPKVSAAAPRNPARQQRPTARLDGSKQWTLTFRTSCGTFVVRLEPAISPHATASLVALARRGFFDHTLFHRIVPGFVVQGGDPSQTGGGGPGYTTVDTPRQSTRYVKGIVAMAKTQTESRGTAGSQFFVMTADAPSLSPDYAVVGRVVSGLAIVERIGTLGDPSDPNGTPTQAVNIERVTVTAR